ncbi:SagB family peptide dehydrogenase [Streptomyces sp. NPDC052299]|uniref:SagB/ThcOx family dehydrogenase n=1 Tax=Streptomyces sp. NPDC052299 TaxID=3155054 RepID=UPI0034198514
MSGAPDRARRIVRLREGVNAVRTATGVTALTAWPHVGAIGRLSEGQHAALRKLAADTAPEDLAPLCPAGEAVELLARLRAGGWLIGTVVGGDGTALFTTRHLWPPKKPAPPAEPRTLSRFAAVRRDGDALLVESPVASCVLRLYDSRLVETVVTAGAGEPSRSGLPAGLVELLLDDLADGGFLASAAETDTLGGAQWSPHELAFHHGSRLRHEHRMGEDFGGTYWARDTFPAPPGPHPVWTAGGIELARPDPQRLRAQDPPLAAVMEDRRSLRAYDEARPLTVEELGEFLFRTARVRATGADQGLDVSDRPHPGGGAAHELELYPLVHRVRGLESGLYHYDPYHHRLSRVPARAGELRRLLTGSAAGMTGDATPQVLVVLASRFGRLAWKYRAMAYALTLKHVGVLYQNMYLAATAMGLAPCALGVGDSDAFAAATGLDALTETSVGEFALGSRPRAAHEETG